MNEINLVEILKDAPIGIKLWSPIFGECEFQGISSANKSAIICTHTIKEYVLGNDVHEFADFLDDGRLATCCSEDGECLLFPSKENRDWNTFTVPWKHKHFEQFQKVLVKSYDAENAKDIWTPSLYGCYVNEYKKHCSVAGIWYKDDEIIPYEGNEDKIGKIMNEKII